MGGSDTIVVAPQMEMLPAITQKPRRWISSGMHPRGGVSLGAECVSGTPGLFIGLHLPDGEAIVGALGGEALRAFRNEMDALLARVDAGEFDQPRRMA